MSDSLHGEAPAELGDDLESSAAFEWARISTFLRASEAPLAIIEIASESDAEEVIGRIRSIARDDVHVFHPDPERDFRWPLDWLESHGERPGIFLFEGIGSSYATDEESACRFWTWANMQRERWQRDRQKVVFLLPPAQVDALCRYAPMLWDWIPLKFNLTGQDPGEQQNALAAAMRAAVQRLGESEIVETDDAEQRAKRQRTRLDGLRQQLLRARQKGLPEQVVLRDYAWPFFQTLIEAGELEEARRVMDSELGYEFPAGLPFHQAAKAMKMLEELSGRTITPERVAKVGRAIRPYFESASWPYGRGVGASAYRLLRGELASFSEDFTAAERWLRGALACSERLGFDEAIAMTLESQGNVFAKQGRHGDAADCYSKALARWEKIGKDGETARLLSKVARSQLQQAQMQRQPDSTAHTRSRSASAPQRGASPRGRSVRAALRATHRLAERLDAYIARKSGTRAS